MKTASPTGSYLVSLPDGTTEEYDGRVSSFWCNKQLLLQLSSHKRVQDFQVSSSQRLADRLKGKQQAKRVKVAIPGCPDVAGAVAKEDDGLFWLYCYASWPDLMIFITISGPSESIVVNGWASKAVKSIEKKFAT